MNEWWMNRYKVCDIISNMIYVYNYICDDPYIKKINLIFNHDFIVIDDPLLIECFNF